MDATQKSQERAPAKGTAHGYIKAKDKELLQEAYCIEVLTQIASVVAALEKVGAILLKDHVEHCVRESIEKGEDADEKIEELTAAVERFLRV